MTKYIQCNLKGERTELVFEIERQSYKTTFRTPDNFFAHATRTVWYSVTGFNRFVLYKGVFYLIDRMDNGDEITTLEFDVISAEEAATVEMNIAAKAMDEARKADDAAVSFCAAYTEATGEIPYADDAAAVCRVARHDIAHQIISTRADREIVADMVEDIARATRSRKPYQRHELEAYLGEPDAYDVDAIEAEATTYTADGARVWSAFGSDLAAIAERHEIVNYYAI